MRTIETFLSHAAHDVDGGWIEPLDIEQRLRGLDVWRDREKLLGGQPNWREIAMAIRRCAVMVVVITPVSITRDAVWKELKLADDRWKLDPDFPIFPIRIGVTREELNAACRKHRIHDLGEHWDHEVAVHDDGCPRDPHWAREAAHKIVDSAVEARVRDAGSRPLVIALRTRAERTLHEPDLDLDWSSCFDGGEPDASTWDGLLIALTDATDAVKQRTRQTRIGVELICRLGAAFALGWSIPRTGPRQLDLYHPPPRDSWPTDARPDNDGRTRVQEVRNVDGEATLGAVLVSIWRDAREMHNRSPDLRRAGRMLEVDRADGDPLTAANAAWLGERIGGAIRAWCDTEGVREVHVFGVMPTGLAVLIGRQLNATTDVAFFHDAKGVYIEACRLSVGTKGAGTLLRAEEEPSP